MYEYLIVLKYLSCKEETLHCDVKRELHIHVYHFILTFQFQYFLAAYLFKESLSSCWVCKVYYLYNFHIGNAVIHKLSRLLIVGNHITYPTI